MKTIKNLTKFDGGYYLVPNPSNTADQLVFLRGQPSTVSYSPDTSRIWYTNRDGTFLEIFDTATARPLASFKIESEASLLQVDPEHRILFLTLGRRDGDCRMVIIDLEAGEILREIDQLPNLLDPSTRYPAPSVAPMNSQGDYLFAATEGPGGRRRSLLVTLNPSDGSFGVESIVQEGEAEPQYMVGLSAPSADGRYWLRAHGGHFRTRQRMKRRLGFFKVPDGPKEYAIEVQLWQTEPLRFVKTLVVDWLVASQFPMSDSFRSLNSDTAVAITTAMLDTISRISKNHEGSVKGGLVAQELKGSFRPEEFADKYEANWSEVNQERWDFGIGQYISAVSRDVLSITQRAKRPVWTDNGEAIWFNTGPHFVCVGLDGSISQRVATDPVRLSLPQVVVGATRTAKVITNNKMILDLEASSFDNDFELPPLTPEARPMPDQTRGDLDKIRAQIKALRKTATHLPVKLRDLSAESLEGALHEIAKGFRSGATDQADDNRFGLRFYLGRKKIEESEVWASVAKIGHALAPALSDVVSAFLDNTRTDDLYISPDDGVSTLAYAVEVLAKIDVKALNGVVRQYGEHYDSSHHYVFYGQIVQTALEAHHWTDETIRFGLWAMLLESGNAGEPSDVWVSHGLGPLMRERYSTSEAFELVKQVCQESELDRAFGTLKYLLADSQEPWDNKMGKLLEV